MSLTARISVAGDGPDGPEDYLSTSLGVIFPDDVTNQHGDADHSLVYASPYLPKPLFIELADPRGETDRRLFSHYLWNASLLLAELIERDTLGIEAPDDRSPREESVGGDVSFNVKGLSLLELGAGTALPSMMAGLVGAEQVVVTDYPAPTVMKTLRTNIARNITPELCPDPTIMTKQVTVDGHEWGLLSDDLSLKFKHTFQRIIVSDCLWMPWQHKNLHLSIAHFLMELKKGVGGHVDTANEPCCWVCAGFHTGREKLRMFFEKEALAEAGLRIESIWERDCDGVERDWMWDREEDVTERKRWLVVATLKKMANP